MARIIPIMRFMLFLLRGCGAVPLSHERGI
jgi:hypothetical protein